VAQVGSTVQVAKVKVPKTGSKVMPAGRALPFERLALYVKAKLYTHVEVYENPLRVDNTL